MSRRILRRPRGPRGLRCIPGLEFHSCRRAQPRPGAEHPINRAEVLAVRARIDLHVVTGVGSRLAVGRAEITHRRNRPLNRLHRLHTPRRRECTCGGVPAALDAPDSPTSVPRRLVARAHVAPSPQYSGVRCPLAGAHGAARRHRRSRTHHPRVSAPGRSEYPRAPGARRCDGRVHSEHSRRPRRQ